jgi:hypothetical protein
MSDASTIDLPTIMGKIQQFMDMRAKGYPQGAEPLMREAVLGLRDVLGPKHPMTSKFAADIASVLQELGKADKAEALLAEVATENVTLQSLETFVVLKNDTSLTASCIKCFNN